MEARCRGAREAVVCLKQVNAVVDCLRWIGRGDLVLFYTLLVC